MDTDTLNKRLAEFERRSIRFLELDQDVDQTHVLTVNECGWCVACCVHPAIRAEQYRELGMPPTKAKPYGQPCVHCTGRGCGVYDVRPSVCRGYQCLWKFGLVDTPPNISGVAWSFEPNMETLAGWVVVGQCDSAEKVLADNEQLLSIDQLLTIRLLNLRVDFVVVRDKRQTNLVTRRHGNRFLITTCDVTPDGGADPRTMRKRVCKFVQTKALQTA